MKALFNKVFNNPDEPLGLSKKDINLVFNKNPDDIFKYLRAAKSMGRSHSEALIRQQKILDRFQLEYYEFDTINEINGKKTNHQELLYDQNQPIATFSLNKVYKGKLKIWYHKSVQDHICLSATVPHEIVNVAVKTVEHSDAVENENNEPEMLYYLRNEPEVINLLGYHIDPAKELCILVLEWCEGGDLFKYIEKNYFKPTIGRTKSIGISVNDIKYIIRWLIIAISKCHKQDICHSDLKLDNIMLAKVNDLTSLRLIDFGASKFTHDHGVDIIYRFLSTSVYYTPPEVIHNFHIKLNCKFLENYKLHGSNLFKIDIWQIGIIMYSLLHGQFPFNSDLQNKEARNYQIFKQIESCPPLKFTRKKDINGAALCNANCIDLLNKLIAFNPMDRISLDDALCHPWLLN